jgi:DNA-binding NarL/FixJ family response regulator
MLRWTQLLGFRPKQLAADSRPEANRTIRLLAITANDQFYSGLVDIAGSCGWEIRRASSVKEGLDVVRSLGMPLVLFDWDESGHDWRHGLNRLASAHCHPCVLLASRVADENMRQEVIRFHGYDVLPRSADRDQVVRKIQFAWFWITRQRRFADGSEQEGDRQ